MRVVAPLPRLAEENPVEDQEDDPYASDDDDPDGSTTRALHAMEYRRSSAIERQEQREQELAAYSLTVSGDIDRQTMELLKEAESTPSAEKEQALRNKINVGVVALVGVSSWRRKANSSKNRETVREQLVRVQREQVDAKWKAIQEANRLQRAMLLAMRDKAQLGPLFITELAFDILRAAEVEAERRARVATCMVSRWRGALCRRAYRETKTVNTTMTLRHRVRAPSSLRLTLSIPTPSLRLACATAAFFRAVVAHVVPVPRGDRRALARALSARITRRDVAELRWCAPATPNS